MPERGNPRVRVSQDKDRLRVAVAAEGGDDQFCLAAACGCLYGTPGDLQEVKVVRH
jgi:anti-sigma regulatory factor (Ser/Thr protein kinase)